MRAGTPRERRRRPNGADSGSNVSYGYQLPLVYWESQIYGTACRGQPRTNGHKSGPATYVGPHPSSCQLLRHLWHVQNSFVALFMCLWWKWNQIKFSAQFKVKFCSYYKQSKWGINLFRSRHEVGSAAAVFSHVGTVNGKHMKAAFRPSYMHKFR